MSNKTHGWNIVYLNGRWEIVDVNAGIRSARIGTDNKAYAANVKTYWAKQKTGDDYTTVGPFCTTAYGTWLDAGTACGTDAPLQICAWQL